jgi:hypothetical protein
MSKHHLSAVDIDIFVGNLSIHVQEFSAQIQDEGKAVKTAGVPDGFVEGDVSGSGSITVDVENLNLLIEVARTAGSFKGMPPFDIITTGANTTQSQKFELFGCKLKVSDLFNSNGSGGEKLTTKIDYEVTDSRFIRMNGVPYLPNDRTRNFIAG